MGLNEKTSFRKELKEVKKKLRLLVHLYSLFRDSEIST